MRAALVAVLLLAAGPMVAAAQKGTIFGTVRDSSAVPVAGVDVLLIPGGGRTRTDAEGRYTIGNVDNGAYTVMARRIGFAPERWDVRLSDKGRLEVDFVMHRRSDLDTIKVVGTCDGLGVTGFECRKRAAKGGSIFLDYPDIDAFDERYTADVFRHIEGFFVVNRVGPQGHVFPEIQLKPRPYKCLNTFVDGRPSSEVGRGVPRLTKDVVSIELYLSTDSVPMTDPRYLYLMSESSYRAKRCGALFFWTVDAPINPPKASLAPKTPPSQLRSASR